MGAYYDSSRNTGKRSALPFDISDPRLVYPVTQLPGLSPFLTRRVEVLVERSLRDVVLQAKLEGLDLAILDVLPKCPFTQAKLQ